MYTNIEWWHTLKPIWKKALLTCYLRKPQDHDPTESELEEILKCKVLRIVGPSGMYPNFDEELEDLSGLESLNELEILVLTHHKLTHLNGIENASNLKSLFVNDNVIEDLTAISEHILLVELYVHNNKIDSLRHLSKLYNLHTLVCDNNHLQSFEGITNLHKDLKTVKALPNEGLGPKQIRELEDLNIFCK